MMRFFVLSNWRDVILFFFPTVLLALTFGLALGYASFQIRRLRREKKGHFYPEGIEEQSKPFPAALVVIIVGTILWAFFYILFTGLLEVII